MMTECKFKVGDSVAISRPHNTGACGISTIERIGKRDIVLKNGERFRLDGHGFGIWSQTMIWHAAPEDIEEVRRKRAYGVIHDASFGEYAEGVSLELMERVAAGLKATRRVK
jgi:hypothetical protein